jgi:hypothetical protein
MATSGVLGQLRELKSQIDSAKHEVRVAENQKHALAEKLQQGALCALNLGQKVEQVLFFTSQRILHWIKKTKSLQQLERSSLQTRKS